MCFPAVPSHVAPKFLISQLTGYVSIDLFARGLFAYCELGDFVLTIIIFRSTLLSLPALILLSANSITLFQTLLLLKKKWTYIPF